MGIFEYNGDCAMNLVKFVQKGIKSVWDSRMIIMLTEATGINICLCGAYFSPFVL